MRNPVRRGWDAKKDCQAGARTRKGPRSSRRVRLGSESAQEEMTASSMRPQNLSWREVRFGLRKPRVQSPGDVKSEKM